jgi:hypothetical protein
LMGGNSCAGIKNDDKSNIDKRANLFMYCIFLFGFKFTLKITKIGV